MAAPAGAIWEVAADVTRVGEWNGECRGCTSVASNHPGVPGARFRGRNRRGKLRWTRLTELVKASRAHLAPTGTLCLPRLGRRAIEPRRAGRRHRSHRVVPSAQHGLVHATACPLGRAGATASRPQRRHSGSMLWRGVIAQMLATGPRARQILSEASQRWSSASQSFARRAAFQSTGSSAAACSNRRPSRPASRP
jgi:hypothetical protein